MKSKVLFMRLWRIKIMNSVIIFAIVFLLMMLGMGWFLIANFRTLPVVKAGKVTKICNKNEKVFGLMPDKIRLKGQSIDLSKDIKMVVCGNSMKYYNIHNGQRIYVEKIEEAEKGDISTFPVLVLDIVNNPNKEDAAYKLRKFVGYTDNEDWSGYYEKLRNRIKVPEDIFVSQCSEKYRKMNPAPNEQLVLSETYDEDKNEVCYSLHPVSSIYGKVKYAI